MRVRIEPKSTTATVHLDGEDQSDAIRAYKLEQQAGKPAELTLTLAVWDTEIGGDATVAIPDATRDLLVQLGWTPPEEDQ